MQRNNPTALCEICLRDSEDLQRIADSSRGVEEMAKIAERVILEAFSEVASKIAASSVGKGAKSCIHKEALLGMKTALATFPTKKSSWCHAVLLRMPKSL